MKLPRTPQRSSPKTIPDTSTHQEISAHHLRGRSAFECSSGAFGGTYGFGSSPIRCDLTAVQGVGESGAGSTSARGSVFIESRGNNARSAIWDILIPQRGIGNLDNDSILFDSNMFFPKIRRMLGAIRISRSVLPEFLSKLPKYPKSRPGGGSPPRLLQLLILK